MLLSTVCFTANVLLVRTLSALGFDNVWLVACARFVVGLAVTATVYRHAWQPVHLFRSRKLVERGLAGGFGVFISYLAIVKIGAGRATFINNTYVVWGALLAAWLLREMLRPAVVTGSIVALAGLALLTDIIRHLSYAYEDKGLESLLDRDDKGRLFVKSTGVVLIDEIDAHLHPEWQREIGFWLKRHFPNIQFLVTTHSPIICQAADPGGLFVLPEPGSGREPRRLSDAERDKIIASRPDTILLSPAFGLQSTRSPVAVEARAEYARLEGKKRSTGKLNLAEQTRFKQLELFVNTGEDV